MTPGFLQKIRTVAEIGLAIGPRPRAKSVIMCHGVFDIVHPGHLRHLIFAKEKADVLIASITADIHITKGNLRPLVPEELRATNLAALELVDFVVIDQNPTPIENIAAIQPDYFAKGYEYCSNGVPPKTQEEMTALEQFGGEMVFTPGDVVYSSSAIIEAQPPRIPVEKLLALMHRENLSFDDLRAPLRAMNGVRVHVVGDTIVDSYSYCSLLGATAKSPTFSLKHDRTDTFSGGAAVVAKHMRIAGAQVSFSTVLGDDRLRDFVLHDLNSCGITCLPVIDKTRPTTHKERFLAARQKMLQVDRVESRAISDAALARLATTTSASGADVVVFSDFRHGIFNRRHITALKASIPSGAMKVADSQVSNRWGNILDFLEFDLLTPNEREARFALADQDSSVRPLASEVYRQTRCRYLILKLGELGLVGYRGAGTNPHESFAVDTFVDQVVDPIGAGDALLAYATLGLSVSGNIVIAAILGSLAAAIACETLGNVPVSPQGVATRLQEIEKRARLE